MMLLRFMSEFLSIMPTQLPDLLPRKTMEDPIVYDDYAQLTFHPSKQLTLAEVADQLEEQANLTLLYHRVVSEGLRGWQCCCAFSKPNNGRMYKFNATAGDDGIVDTITVCVFESIEVMRGTLRLELQMHHKAGGMRYEMGEAELIKLFY